MIPSPDNRLIKTALKVFRYDEVLTDWGWEHDVYYDPESQTYVVTNFPQEGHFFEISMRPELGPGEMTIDNKKYYVTIHEK